MNPNFAADTAAIFSGPLAVAASYTPTGGSPIDVQVIPSLEDKMMSFGAGRFVADAAVFLIPVAALASPVEGDVLTIADVGVFTVQGAPIRDARRLWWRIEARPS